MGAICIGTIFKRDILVDQSESEGEGFDFFARLVVLSQQGERWDEVQNYRCFREKICASGNNILGIFLLTRASQEEVVPSNPPRLGVHSQQSERPDERGTNCSCTVSLLTRASKEENGPADPSRLDVHAQQGGRPIYQQGELFRSLRYIL